MKALPTPPGHYHQHLPSVESTKESRDAHIQQQEQICNFQKGFNNKESEVSSHSEINVLIEEYQHNQGSTNEDSYEQLSSPSTTSQTTDEVLPSPQIPTRPIPIIPDPIPLIVIDHVDPPSEKSNKKEEPFQIPFPQFQILPNSLVTEGYSTSHMNTPQNINPMLLSASQLEVVSNVDYEMYSQDEFSEYDDQSAGVLDMSNLEPQDEDDTGLSSRTVSPPEWNLDQIDDFDEEEFYMDEEYAIIDKLDSSIFEIEEKNNLEIDYKRIRLIKELKKTEINYLKTLSTFQIYYINPLKEMKQSIVPKDFLQKAIGEMGIIYRVNKMFYDKLDHIIDIPETDEDSVLYEYCKNRTNNNMEIELAKEISKFGHTLKLYIGYITKYKSSIEQLNIEKKKNKKFERYLQEAFLNIAKDGLIPSPPSSYLIAPIQRIPRYQLLLSEIVKCSKHLPEVHELLAKATGGVVSVAEYCNEKEREIQNMTKMHILSKKLRNKMIIHPSRKFLSEALFDFKKKGRSGTVTLYLFSDILLVVERGIVQKSKMIPFNAENLLKFEDHGIYKFLKQGENKIYTLTPKNGDKAQKEFFEAFSNMLTNMLNSATTPTTSEVK
ncbi:RhoGEF domain-containing protein [Naegleria gruberi]|uniref:RhoGEF domain-containing protein n=1 Tax=Naegleria gruberi TaxID=5762 RepID=D2VQI2_NAEGR|nr:RhoGEF domain-containing protein [Naegleria gruberi]EFC40954.1 RhoGEF domain-containing protein [Naegleria gruberi]|eukprot:XP_002673698.1 RhoGEF domain-containing protein [Naegleria gruberi strain NEG-M]